MITIKKTTTSIEVYKINHFNGDNELIGNLPQEGIPIRRERRFIIEYRSKTYFEANIDEVIYIDNSYFDIEDEDSVGDE
jgi:hypothetical protein